MSKVHAMAGGCLVRGRWTRVDGTPVAGGTIVITPQRGGVWRGRIISRMPVRAPTKADGRFEIELAPSSAVGLYEIAMDNLKLYIEVPYQPQAELTDLVIR